jgi:hypothetical protein
MTPPEGPPTPDLATLKVHFRCVLFVLGADVVLKALVKLSAVLGLVNPSYRSLVDMILNYFTGIAVVVFSLVAILVLACNGWAAVYEALRSTWRK